MNSTVYRLAGYKIIQTVTGQLTWETHSGFSAFQEGQCFIKGSILFIGPAENNRHGFLKGEFLDDLNKYPKWMNTKYYCLGLTVHHCKDGTRVTKKEMTLWIVGRSADQGGGPLPEARRQSPIHKAAMKVTDNVAYKLQRYEITIMADGQISWKTHWGQNVVRRGKCFILEDILFFRSWPVAHLPLSKQQFLRHLNKLPEWSQTIYFSNKLSVKECKAETSLRGNWNGKQDRASKRTAMNTDTTGQRKESLSEIKENVVSLMIKTHNFFLPLAKKYILRFGKAFHFSLSLFMVYIFRIWKGIKTKWDFFR
ncbi:MAG: hypothetical protein JEZ11_14645 [Desulfobacterales bacterium]|nr:hypothetical protein [Desulfobacterales bacterium]